MGATLPVYVPDRLLEGYGPSPAVFRRMKADGIELVITVDCGAAATDALDAAADIGLDVVVVDHHLMREVSPSAAALVNPNRADCRSGQGVLAAAGVTFVLLAALNREARARGLFADRHRTQSAPVARSRRARRDLRRDTAHRLQSRAGDARSPSDVDVEQPRSRRADARRRGEVWDGGRIRGRFHSRAYASTPGVASDGPIWAPVCWRPTIPPRQTTSPSSFTC